MTSASADKFITATAFQHVDQVTPTPAASYQSVSIVQPLHQVHSMCQVQLMIWFFDIFDYFKGSTAPNSATFGGGQTMLINQGPLTITSSGFGYYSTSFKAGVASVAMIRTTPSGPNGGEVLIHIAFNIKAGGPIITLSNLV
ncbi:MAG: hypothetical protein IPO92_06560 [Saprospiraceae bacterium]|nr:hypothetical protein [Saprospiraceae bacterium]